MASPRLMALINAKKKQLEAQRNKFWKPVVGNNIVRILPSWIDDESLFYKESFSHYNVGPNNAVVACLEQFNEKCPVCWRAEKLISSNVSTDQQRAYEIRKQQRVFMNVLPDNDPEGVIKIWSISANPRNFKNLFSELISYYANTAWGDFTDPETGYNFDLTAAKKRVPLKNGRVSEFMDYVLQPQRNTSYVGKATWADELYDLDAEILQYKKSPDQIIAIMKGQVVDESE